MKPLFRALTLAGLMAVSTLTGAPLHAQSGQPKNVQVLKDKPIKELRDFMKNVVADGIGAKCNFCHNMKDYSSDEIKNKQIAREMLKMVNDINTQVAAINRSVMKKGELKTVTCYTCHRGDVEIYNSEEDETQ